MGNTDFDFGESKQGGLFEAEEASVAMQPAHQSAEGGSIPTPPLQTIPASEIRIHRIEMSVADGYSIKHHYLHRTAKNSKLALGIYARGIMHGIMIWGLPVAKIKGQYGRNFTQLELRRMYCDEELGKNSESRCLAYATRLIHKLMPQVKDLIAYSDLSHGHKGGIYRAAGWTFAGRIEADTDGGWSKHPRHNRVEFGDKYKWVKHLFG
jgi:hypothetical protein